MVWMLFSVNVWIEIRMLEWIIKVFSSDSIRVIIVSSSD